MLPPLGLAVTWLSHASISSGVAKRAVNCRKRTPRSGGQSPPVTSAVKCIDAGPGPLSQVSQRRPVKPASTEKPRPTSTSLGQTGFPVRWQMRDSNPRRQCQLIYSQPPLAARVICRTPSSVEDRFHVRKQDNFTQRLVQESNRRSSGLQTAQNPLLHLVHKA